MKESDTTLDRGLSRLNKEVTNGAVFDVKSIQIHHAVRDGRNTS